MPAGSAPTGQPWDLPVALLGATRSYLDDVHDWLSHHGHPGTRPLHGFALQAVGEGASIGEMAARLGVTKQAAAKTVALLADQGYVTRTPDPADARRSVVTRSARGEDFLRASVAAFGEVRRDWARTLRADRLDTLEEALALVAGDASRRLDLPGWVV